MEKLMIFGFLVWLVLSCCSNLYGSIRSVFFACFLGKQALNFFNGHGVFLLLVWQRPFFLYAI